VALKLTKDPTAAPPLERELLDPEIALAARTVVVDSFGSAWPSGPRGA
jgi:hypothetical protein